MLATHSTKIPSFSNRLDAEDITISGQDFVPDTTVAHVSYVLAVAATAASVALVLAAGTSASHLLVAALVINIATAIATLGRKLQKEINRRRFAESIAKLYIDHEVRMSAIREPRKLALVA